MGLILSSLRETEASLLSEITVAVGREVWGKYFNKESWEFQLQLERAPRGQVGGEHEWKFAASLNPKEAILRLETKYASHIPAIHPGDGKEGGGGDSQNLPSLRPSPTGHGCTTPVGVVVVGHPSHGVL